MNHAPAGQHLAGGRANVNARAGGHIAKGRNTIMHPNSQNGSMDPFGRVNPKARKVIESVERQRQTPADPRAGSTGGSFDEDLEFGNKQLHAKANAMQNFNAFHPHQAFNQTAQTFYSPADGNFEVIDH